jgi:hypothetical protein
MKIKIEKSSHNKTKSNIKRLSTKKQLEAPQIIHSKNPSSISAAIPGGTQMETESGQTTPGKDEKTGDLSE